MKSYHVHYLNKYPGGRVASSDSSVDAFDKDGRHCVALRLSGAGSWVDMSKELGCAHEHDLSPIPKDARPMKLAKSGLIEKDEKHDERLKSREQFVDDGRVLSCEQLAKKGMKFDEKQVLLG